jgi:hypothetical protein
MCIKRYERHSCGCRGKKLEPRQCQYDWAISQIDSFNYSASQRAQRVGVLRQQCRQAMWTGEVYVEHKCTRCQRDAMDRLMAERAGGSGWQ